MSGKAIRSFRYTGVTRDIVSLIPDIVYSRRNGHELKLSLFVQKSLKYDAVHAERLPLIVYLEGSGYLQPNYNVCMGQLASLASHGFTVAMVTPGSFLDGWSFEDIHINYKTAIRCLRANADIYGIEPDHVIAWGTSSGGTSAAFAGLSGDRAEYKTAEYAQFSDQVQCVVCLAGPQDLFSLLNDTSRGKFYHENWLLRNSQQEWETALSAGSTAFLLKENRIHCPFYLVHSDSDEMVPFDQTAHFYQQLQEANHIAEMVLLKGAPHQNGLTTDILEDAVRFIRHAFASS